MAKKIQNNKPLSGLVSEIEEHADVMMQYPDATVQLAAAQIKNTATRIQASFIGLRLVLWMALAFLLLAGLMVATLYESNNKIKQLNNELIERSQPSKTDSLKDKILLDSTGNVVYSVDNAGAPIAYHSLQKENARLQDSLHTTLYLLNFAKENYGLKYSVKREGNKILYTMSSSAVEMLDKTIEDATNTINEKNKKNQKFLDSIK